MCLNSKNQEAYLVHTERVPALYSGNRGRCQAVLVGVLDLMGGKPGCAFGDGAVSPTITRGRASASDVHAVVIEED